MDCTPKDFSVAALLRNDNKDRLIELLYIYRNDGLSLPFAWCKAEMILKVIKRQKKI